MFETTFSDLTRALKKFTAEPLCADLFQWCWDTKTHIGLRTSLPSMNIRVELYTPVSSLKARIERQVEVERGRQARQHWSFSMDRLIALKQALATIEKFRSE